MIRIRSGNRSVKLTRQEPSSQGMSNDDLSRFNAGMIIVVEDPRETVVEYAARLGKTHAVLPAIRLFLSRIPFENYRQSSAYQFLPILF